MITKIEIKRFKSIQNVCIRLGKVNVLVGANNSGKSSILQAIQFTTSVAQTAGIYSTNAQFKADGNLATSVYPDQLVYSPVKDPYTLAQGGILKEDLGKAIQVMFENDSGERVIASFRKGRNKNISAKYSGKEIGETLLSLENPFSMYVPGLAGIPFEEEIRSVGIIRRFAAKGDSNTVFRNVLYRLSEQPEKWDSFLSDIQSIFPNIRLNVLANPESDGQIAVSFRFSDEAENLPIDLAGTGVLQAIQIAGYVNYFHPQLLLLDEPDSHLHPDNQRLLAAMLLKLADRNQATIIISTHSRHLMAALREDATFFLIHNGNVSEDRFDHYAGLLELGALDEYDLIKSGQLKYVVLTEDSSVSASACLEKVLEASGFLCSEYKVYSYNSISKIDSAKLFAQFLLDLNPSLNVIIYRDRDGLYDDEIEDVKSKIEFDPRVKCVIAQGNDIEMYFCNIPHIMYICEAVAPTVTDEEISALIVDAMTECEEESKRKFYAHRTELARRNQADPGGAMLRAEQEFSSNKEKYIYGKKLSGLITAKLQQRLGQNMNIFTLSPSVSDPVLAAIHVAA